LNAQDSIVGSETDTNALAWGDFNGDGAMDLFVGRAGANELYVSSEGGLSLLMGSGATDTGYATRAVATGDLNGDGHTDIVVGNTGGPVEVYIHSGQPFAAFSSRQTFPDDSQMMSTSLALASFPSHCFPSH
jgi:hypothetical protein